MLIFLGAIAVVALSINIDASFVQSGFSGKAIVVHKPHEGLNLIGDFKLPNPGGGSVGSLVSPPTGGNVLIDTFTGESVIPPKSSKRGIMT